MKYHTLREIENWLKRKTKIIAVKIEKRCVVVYLENGVRIKFGKLRQFKVNNNFWIKTRPKQK